MYTITNPITKTCEIDVNQEESKAFSYQGIDNETTTQHNTTQHNTTQQNITQKDLFIYLFWTTQDIVAYNISP
jgi:hypothetical protein